MEKEMILQDFLYDLIFTEEASILIQSEEENPLFKEFCEYAEKHDVHQWNLRQDPMPLYEYAFSRKMEGYDMIQYENNQIVCSYWNENTRELPNEIEAVTGSATANIVEDAAALLWS